MSGPLEGFGQIPQKGSSKGQNKASAQVLSKSLCLRIHANGLQFLRFVLETNRHEAVLGRTQAPGPPTQKLCPLHRSPRTCGPWELSLIAPVLSRPWMSPAPQAVAIPPRAERARDRNGPPFRAGHLSRERQPDQRKRSPLIPSSHEVGGLLTDSPPALSLCCR